MVNSTPAATTQSFNTTTSMGRLTLNILLSFAQFERELSGERVRDKIAASRKRGIWMGGMPALGPEVGVAAPGQAFPRPRILVVEGGVDAEGALGFQHQRHMLH